MEPLIQHRVGARTATIAHSSKADGDLAPRQVDPLVLVERRAAIVDRPWRAAHQVHSDRVLIADAADATASDLLIGDALVTAELDVVVAAHAGDCVPVGFIASGDPNPDRPTVAVAAAHAGWAGLERGVLESTVRSLHNLTGAGTEITCAVGPHIRAEHYEFGRTDLSRLQRRFGPQVASTTADGTPALDLSAAVRHELARLGARIQVYSPACTAADSELYWSHRARRESGRIALVAWITQDLPT